jgi:hypothetical protein
MLDSVARHRINRWLAIDDDNNGWPDISYERLVVCNEPRGLSDAVTQEDLARKLVALLTSALSPAP